MSKKRVEDVICDVLKDDAQRNALDFASYLRVNEMQLEESENYWDVRFKGKSVCYIWVGGSDEKPGPWTIWSDQEPGTWIAWSAGDNRNGCKDPVVDEHIKEIAWANVNFCANCGGDCSPGKRKIIWGKEFNNVCSSAIAFTNPDTEALNCAKRMIDTRIDDILRNYHSCFVGMDSDYLLEFAADSYGFDRDTLQFVATGRDKSRQFYAFIKCDNEYILRIVECCSSRMGQVIAEMDWLCYLAEKGVSVSVPLRAGNGDLAILSEENGETTIICAYTRVKGQLWDKNDPKLWNERVFYNWGKVMGDMHRITKDYMPAEGQEKRPEFSSIILNTVKAFPSVNKVAEEVFGEIGALPKDRDSYGLIHYDLNPCNFMIDGERINVFDFADCAYAWYALDIGCALTVGLWLGRCNDAGYDFTNKIIMHFLNGYLSANALEDFWLSKIPLFMKLCQIAGFSCTYNCVNPDDEQQRELVYNIENNIFLTDCTIDYSLFRITDNDHNASRL